VKRILVNLCLVAAALSLGTPPTIAKDGMSFIRDTEIENTIRVYVAPLFEVAGLDPSAVKIHIVNDRNLNAFVAGGQRIFIHTGLLMRSDSPEQLIGVLAHEIGHIKGGHLARLHKGLRNATSKSILALILGGAVAVASGNPAGIVAGATASATVSQRSMLAYTRTMEQAADQAALSFLEKTGQSARGLLEFLELLRSEENLLAASGNVYIRSHPLTTDRLAHVRENVATSKFSNVPATDMLKFMHRRMRGKLKGFINPPRQTLREYTAEDPDIEAHYARAIALSHMQETDAALAIIDKLIAATPKDPFLHEMQAEILMLGGRTEAAMRAYETAIELLPWAALMRIGLARLQLDQNDIQRIAEARTHLKEALRWEDTMPSAWRFLATAEGRLGNQAEASLALAEEALLRRNKKLAKTHAKRALDLLPHGSPGWHRAQDIEAAATQDEE